LGHALRERYEPEDRPDIVPVGYSG